MSDITPENFCYWLNGFFDLNAENELTGEQVKVIREHLKLVFNQKVEGVPLFEGSKKVLDTPERTYPTHDLLKPIC